MIFVINGVGIETPGMNSAAFAIQPTLALMTHVTVAVVTTADVGRQWTHSDDGEDPRHCTTILPTMQLSSEPDGVPGACHEDEAQ